MFWSKYPESHMKLTHVFLIIFLVSLTRGICAQELPGRKTYFKDDNVTAVTTPNLTLVDTPAQLMQLQLKGIEHREMTSQF